MSESGQWFVASTEGSAFTLYAFMKVLGIPLTKRQEDIQSRLERIFPPIIHKEERDGKTSM